MADRARRPFWVHQLAEYLIGVMLVFTGLQAQNAAVPSILGGLVVVNAAIVDGPFSAFDVVGRRAHQVADIVLIVAMLLSAAMPFLDIDAGTRLVIAGVGVVLAFVWWYSSYESRPVGGRVASSGEVGERRDVGRMAGRLAGRGVNAWRNRPR